MKKFSELLKGERIELRLLKPTFEMSQTIFNEVEKNREHLLPWMGWASKEKTKTVEDTFKYLLEVSEKRKKGEHFDYGIFFKNEYLGNLGIFDIDKDNRAGEIGYWLKKNATRKGYMKEAVKIIENEFFSGDGLNRIQICCDVDNISSANVAKKLKYLFEREKREATFCKLQNKFISWNIFSKLKSEWENKDK